MTTPILEDSLNCASVMLDAYRDELVKNGLVEEAQFLKGMEIFSLHEAEYALATLRKIHDDRALKQYVIAAIERTIDGCCYQRQAS